ncbi:MAG: ATP-binding cassette domain-containing protein [Polyangia bacterium]
MSAPAIRAVRLAFAHADAVPLLEEVSFHIPEGPGFWGLVGANGVGKTTLLRLILGELQPTRGSLCVEPAGAGVVLCAQSVDEVPEGAAALRHGQDRKAHRLRTRLGLGDADLERWATLSPGERKRWQVGAALYAEPDVLLLDEPSNHLDAEARELLLAALREFRGTALVVSHDRELLDGLTCGTLRLRAGALDLVHLPYSQARTVWESEDTAQLERREAARDRVRAAERRIVAARRDQDAATHGRSTRVRMKNRYDSDARTLGAATLAEWAQARAGQRVSAHHSELARASAELSALAKVPKAPGRSLFVGWSPPQRPLLVSLALDELRAGERVLARDVRVALQRGDRVHLRGRNGAGKTTLLGALLQACTLPRERVLYLPQDLSAEASREVLAEVRAQPAELRGRTLSLLAALGVDPDQVLASSQPSCGEARKLALALALARHAWLLILDEPSNHLDLPSIERLEAALADYPGALLLVCHDPLLAQRLTTRTWSLSEGALDVHA